MAADAPASGGRRRRDQAHDRFVANPVRRYREAEATDDAEEDALWKALEREIIACGKARASAAIAAVEARLARDRATIEELTSLHAYCARVRGKPGPAPP